MMRRFARCMAAAMLLTTGLLLSGCGKEQPQPTVPEAVTTMPETTKEKTEQPQTQPDGGNEPVAAVRSTEETAQEELPLPPVSADGYEVRDETVYATEKVNIRAGAGTDQEKVGSLETGQSVRRTGYTDEWSRVEYNGTVCYIASAFLTTQQPSATAGQPSSSAAQEQWSGDISTLSNDIFSGIASYTDRDAQNVPNGCYYLTKLYSKYNALFIQDTSRNVIYLTMDEGYEAGFTPQILDTLKEKGVKATFFVTKEFYDSNPEYIKRMIDEGHTVGNHTCNHKNMPTLTTDEQTQEVMVLHNLIKDQFGYEMKLFRFPEGSTSEQSLALMQSLGYKSVFWSFHYLDYNDNDQKDPQETLQLCMDSIHPGAIYLLHAKSATNTEILGQWIDAVRAAGYEFGGGLPVD